MTCQERQEIRKTLLAAARGLISLEEALKTGGEGCPIIEAHVNEGYQMMIVGLIQLGVYIDCATTGGDNHLYPTIEESLNTPSIEELEREFEKEIGDTNEPPHNP